MTIPRNPLIAPFRAGLGRRTLGRSILAMLLVSSIALSATSVQAIGLSSGLEGIGVRLNDTELGQMRGKFIRPDSISYFGIMMTTSWQGSDGITTNANLLFKVDFLTGPGGGGTPQLLVGWSRDGDPTLDVGKFGPAAQPGYLVVANGSSDPLAAAGGGALQTTVLSGADNHALNGMAIAIVPASMVSGQVPGGLTPIVAGQVTTFVNGDAVKFDASSGGVGLSVSNDGNFARQSIDSNLGRANQAINIAGNNFSATNLMLITVGTDTSGALQAIQADQAVTTPKIIGF